MNFLCARISSINNRTLWQQVLVGIWGISKEIRDQGEGVFCQDSVTESTESQVSITLHKFKPVKANEASK